MAEKGICSLYTLYTLYFTPAYNNIYHCKQPVLPVEDEKEDWSHEQPGQLSLQTASWVSNPVYNIEFDLNFTWSRDLEGDRNYELDGDNDHDIDGDPNDDLNEYLSENQDHRPKECWIPVRASGCHRSPRDLSAFR